MATFKGYLIEQSDQGIDSIGRILDEDPDIMRVVELGTGHGGSSLYFGSHIVERGGRVLTLDKEDLMDGGLDKWLLFAETHGVERRKIDIFADLLVPDVIHDFIGDSRALLFCDNGHKKKEIPRFVTLLKNGDLIMGHDYGGEFVDEDLPRWFFEATSPFRQEELFPPSFRTMSRIVVRDELFRRAA